MDPNQIIDVLERLDPLCDLPRTGWLLRGVRPCESVAEHSWAVGLVAMMLVDALRAEGTAVDGERVLRMALLHDAAEARTGDVPMPSKTPEVAAAMHALESRLVAQMLPPPQFSHWREAEMDQSLEARIVKSADKVQMMIKAMIYERQGRGRLDDFWANPKNFAVNGLPIVASLFASIAQRAGRPLPSGP